jgi:dextranase
VSATLRFGAAPSFLLLSCVLLASPVAAATLGWIGYTYNFPSAGSVDPATDLFINTETAPHGAAVSALVRYSTNGGTTWQTTALSANGTDGSNDQWHVDLGRFAEGTVIQYAVQATDSLANSLTDSNYGQNFYVKVNTLIRDVYTDKARYNPGDAAQIVVNLVNANNATASGQVRVAISRLFTPVTNFTSSVSLGSGSSTTLTFAWPTLTNDFRGYSVDVDFLTNSVPRDSRSSAIDVSSNWIQFPRYGFFTDLAPGESILTSSNTVFTLSKYHINAAIFYDWMLSHDRLIPYDSGSNIVNNFTDWGGASKSIATITNRIRAAKSRNMSPVAYDLLYGDSGNTNAPEQITWAAFKDPGHTDVADVRSQTNQDHVTQIWIMDVSNPSWQTWIFNQYKDAMTKLGFEGIHLDNLGGALSYKYNSSQSIDESTAFPNFINACKPQLQSVNSKATVTENDVAGNYLNTVAPSATDVYYSEVWGWDHYNDIRTLIQNAKTAGGGKPVVLAAYMNYQSLPQPTNTLNEASVRLMDACVFANGAFHVELGEGNPVQMLSTYYWPTHSPPMPPTLPQVMRDYYDCAVRYENLLFFNSLGGVSDGTSGASLSSGTHALSKDAQTNTIWTVVKLWPGTYDTVSLINLYGVDNIWRNLSGSPTTQTNMQFKYYVDRKVYQVYLATPDDGLGRPQPLGFTDGTDGQGYYVQVTVPQLQYWDLLIFDKTTKIIVDGSLSDWRGTPAPLIHQTATS